MATIFVENCLENSTTIKIVERFGGCAIHRSLKPGENTRITLSRFKSISVEEVEESVEIGDQYQIKAGLEAHTWPTFLERRCG